MQQYKIVIPEKLLKYILNWYNPYLLHPGMDCMEAIICQHLFWPGIRESIQSEVKNYDSCQRNEKLNKKMVKDPLS